MAAGADGRALYVLSPDDHGYCPCALLHLDPATLRTTAQREMPADWALQLFVLHGASG